MDLANEIIRETYRKSSTLMNNFNHSRDADSLRRAMVGAKRFVLDASMSEFAAHLAVVPFKVAKQRQQDVLSSIRHSAIPPFAKMFIQIDNFAFRSGLLAIHADKAIDAWGAQLLVSENNDIVQHMGWLLELDGDDVKITEFFAASDNDDDILTLPFYYIYSLSDKGYVDGTYKGGWLDTKAAKFSHGISHLHDSRFAVVYNVPIEQHPKRLTVEVQEPDKSWTVSAMIVEFGGVMRYVMTFLACLNNIPKIATEVRPHKGYMGGGQIRKYMDYTTLTLSLPVKTTKVNLAKRLIAAARKGWHEVRPHWRMQKEGPCSMHIWSERDQSGHSHCMECAAKRVWIVLPTGRGDPTISVRTHKYIVTHTKD